MKTNLFQKVILAAFVGAVGAVIVSTIGRPASEPSVPQAGKDIRELTEVHGQPLETIKLKSGKVAKAAEGRLVVRLENDAAKRQFGDRLTGTAGPGM